jgi:hypothetical protein
VGKQRFRGGQTFYQIARPTCTTARMTPARVSPSPTRSSFSSRRFVCSWAVAIRSWIRDAVSMATTNRRWEAAGNWALFAITDSELAGLGSSRQNPVEAAVNVFV